MPDGTNVSCEGIVVSCKQTRLHDNQWKQNVQIDDDSGGEYAATIWLGLRLDANTPIVRGTTIRVEEGILGSFDTKYKNKGRNIDVNLYTIPTATEPPPGSRYEYQPQSPKGKKPDWDAKDLRIAKGCALNNATAFVIAIAEALKDSNVLDVGEIKKVANAFVDYIYAPKLTLDQAVDEVKTFKETQFPTDEDSPAAQAEATFG